MTARSARPREAAEHDARLSQEKEVYQIELEQQNEALKSAQEALGKARDKYRELYAEYRDLYDSAPIGYLTLTGKGEITALNTIACGILGGSHDDLIEASLYRFLPLPDKDELFGHLQEVFAERRTRSCELNLQPSFGQGPVRRVHLESILGPRWQSDRVLVALFDITEQDRLKRRLRDTKRLVAIRAASTTLAHEIGNPLNNILTTLQKMARAPDRATAESLLRDTKRIEVETGRLCQLVDEVRQLAAPPRLRTKAISVDALVEEVLRLNARTFEKRGIVIRQLGSSSTRIVGDASKLSQAFANLVQNSVEAAPEHSTVTLRTYALNDWVCIEITNPGEPIPPRLDVFEPFVTSKQHGIGLGLAIVKQIVSAHEGLVTYKSTPQGTEFRVMLPRQETQDVPGA